MNRVGIDIIKASAGSGKTYTLARTYIANLIGIPTGQHIVIGGKQVDCFKLRSVLDYQRHILAITFTNKATNEMKERIVMQLFRLGKGQGDYVDDFKKMFDQNSIQEVAQAARRALSAILFDYGSFNVSTIDSFFQNILRNFAREVDRDYNYDLELDEDYATSVAIHDFLMDLGGSNANQKAVDDWVREFIENNINNKKSWNFFGKSSSDRLKKFASIIYKEFFREHHEEIVKYLSDIGTGGGKSKVLRFRQQLIARRNLRKQSYENAMIAVKDFLVNCGLTVDHIKSNSPVRTILVDHLSAFENSKDTLRKYSQLDDALRTHVIYKRFADEMVTYEQSQQFKSLLVGVFEHANMIDFLNSVIDNIWNLGLLGKIDEKLEQYRKDTNSIMIADTNELISKVLDCGATFIYEHAGNMFNNYMIDEFQDTSRKQYDNFKPLLEESIARGNVNLIIGDEKQSIYRFRNSDPAMLREEIEKAFVTKSVTLDSNYRSFPAIVNFNNSFFESVVDYYRREQPQFESLSKTYKNIVQQSVKNKQEGFVNINVAPYKGRSDKEAREKILKCLPLYINKLRERGYDLSDIAVLVNKRKEGNAVVESILEFNDALGSDNHPSHIDVISAESLLLKNSPSVRLIISVLRFLEISQYELDSENDDDASPNNDFKHFLKKRVAEQRHYKILHDFESRIQNLPAHDDAGEILLSCFEDDKMDDSLNEAQRLNHYSSIAAEVMPDSTMQLTNLVNIVDLIIDKYILHAEAKADAKIENSFLLSFMNVVLEFSRQHNGGTVKEFLLFWEEKKDKLAVSSPSDANAVSVMTIHKSKGLEFKCVIIPFACWDLITPDKVFWVKKSDWVNPSPIEDIGLNAEEIIPPLIPVAPKALRDASLFTPILDEEDEKSLIDNLNKLYVALTRPKEELHIFTTIKEKEFKNETLNVEELNNSAHLLLSFVSIWSRGKLDFTSGVDCLPCDIDSEKFDSSSQDENTNQLAVYNYKFGTPTTASGDDHTTGNDDNHRTMPGYFVSSIKMPVRVSLTDAGASMKEEGVRMHQLFSLINSHDDFDYVLSYGDTNGLFLGNKYWSRKQLEKVFAMIDDDEVLSSWFATGNTVYNERVISYPRSHDDDDHEHRRPDRIIRRPDGEIIVVDYKFGFKTDDATIKEHQNKVSTYMTLLNQLGNHHITGYIWYLRTNKIVKVEKSQQQ